jgi:hypothetical protein
MRAAAEWKPKLRWLMRRILLLSVRGAEPVMREHVPRIRGQRSDERDYLLRDRAGPVRVRGAPLLPVNVWRDRR